MAIASEIREMSDAEILTALDTAKAELFNLRFQLSYGALANPNRMGEVRRDIARYKTVLRERQLAAEVLNEERD